MTTTELLATFANADLIESLTFGDKFSAGLITTVLGMGITFSALIILLIIMSLMNKILHKAPAAPAVKATVGKKTIAPSPGSRNTESDNEVVAAITTAIAMSLQTSTSNIVIRNIEKVENHTPVWNRAGIDEQMNSRL